MSSIGEITHNENIIGTKCCHKKYRWINPETGDTLAAGGILFHDDHSFWAIEEKGTHNDIGGRYSADDGDIFATIRRELYEETYGVFDLLVSQIRKFSTEYGLCGIEDLNKKCIYVCICVPISVICTACGLEEGEIEEKFIKAREKTVKQNPGVHYKPLKIQKIKIEDIRKFKIGYRLRSIIKHIFPLSKK